MINEPYPRMIDTEREDRPNRQDEHQYFVISRNAPVVSFRGAKRREILNFRPLDSDPDKSLCGKLPGNQLVTFKSVYMVIF